MTIRKRVTIAQDGLLEIRHPELPAGAEAEVTIQVDASEQEASASSYDPSARPIWEIAVEIGASVPEQEWANVPRDLSINLDHYLYGAPKEEEEEVE